MPRVVGVAFKPVTKIYHFDPAEYDDLQPGDRVVVETTRGRTLGRVVFAPREVPDSEIGGQLKPVIRRATSSGSTQSVSGSVRPPGTWCKKTRWCTRRPRH